MNYELLEALNQIAREKNVDRDVLIETLIAGLLSAARKRYGLSANIDIHFRQQAIGFDAPDRSVHMRDVRSDELYEVSADPLFAADGAGSIHGLATSVARDVSANQSTASTTASAGGSRKHSIASSS